MVKKGRKLGLSKETVRKLQTELEDTSLEKVRAGAQLNTVLVCDTAYSCRCTTEQVA